MDSTKLFRIKLCFNLLGIVGVNAEVWRRIASKLSEGIQDIVTPGSIRIRVTRNGGNILNILGILPAKKTDIHLYQSVKCMDTYILYNFQLELRILNSILITISKTSFRYNII